MINIKNHDPNKIKIDEKSYKNTLLYYTGYISLKDFRYVKVNSVISLYLLIGKVNGYFEEINGNKNLMLVTTDESKEIMKKYNELWSKIKDLIKPKTNNSVD